MENIKTASDLKYALESRDTESHYFSRENMRFAGDTMKNYGVRKVSILANFDESGKYHPEGIEREVWELYRRRPVKHGLQSSAYFDPVTFNQVFRKI